MNQGFDFVCFAVEVASSWKCLIYIYILNSFSCFCSLFFKGTKFHVNCSQRWHQITSRTNSNLHINSRSTGGAGFHLNCYFLFSWPGGLCLVREKLTCFVLRARSLVFQTSRLLLLIKHSLSTSRYSVSVSKQPANFSQVSDQRTEP